MKKTIIKNFLFLLLLFGFGPVTMFAGSYQAPEATAEVTNVYENGISVYYEIETNDADSVNHVRLASSDKDDLEGVEKRSSVSDIEDSFPGFVSVSPRPA